MRCLRAKEIRAVSRLENIHDVRDIEMYAAGHIPGSLSIALRPVFASWLGWLVTFNRPLVFVLGEDQDRRDLVRQALGIGYEQLRAHKPDLVYVSVSAFGHDGPRGSWPGYEPNAQATTGLHVRMGGAGAPAMQPFAVPAPPALDPRVDLRPQPGGRAAEPRERAHVAPVEALGALQVLGDAAHRDR